MCLGKCDRDLARLKKCSHDTRHSHDAPRAMTDRTHVDVVVVGVGSSSNIHQ